MKRRRTIAVADEDPAIREQLAARLAELGYEVTAAADEAALCAACAAGVASAVVLERDRRRARGPSLVAELRGRTDVPIVILSQRDREEFRNLVMRLPEVYMVPAGLAEDEVARRLRALIGPPARAVAAASGRSSE